MSDWVHHELMNWARWCWLGPLPHPLPPDHAMSLEGNYIPPAEWGEEVITEAKPIPPNADNAKKVQAVFDSATEAERQVMRAEYPQHGLYESRFQAARSFGMSKRYYLMALDSVRDKVRKEFECSMRGK